MHNGQSMESEGAALALYRAMRMARRIDESEADLARRGEAHFHIVTSGHEAIAALNAHLTPDDWLHAHYRDKALLVARGLTAGRYFLNLLAREGSDSGGRRMPSFMNDPALHILSMPTLVGNSALQACGVAFAVRDRPSKPIVYCGIGDGGTQEGEFLEAIAEAVRSRLPVLFVVEDNRYALSTTTRGRTFYSRPDGEAAEFYGVPVTRIDGRDALAASQAFGSLVARMRGDRGPAIAVLQVERLASHTNSDDQTVYRTPDEIARVRAEADPVALLATALRKAGAGVERIDAEIEEEIRAAMAAARAAPHPVAVRTARAPVPARLTDAAGEYRGDPAEGRYTMLEALRETLRSRLAADARVSLYGEDIEDPKGDVFGVSRGLSSQFPGRVQNSPLSESTIVGVAIGRALAGERPVAFLQFADFFPPAFNQIYSELGALYWRTGGAWPVPVVLLAITGGYRPGLGPYHAQSPEAILAHTPGIDVVMPSNAADAAGLLNAAFESGRPTVVLYPKNLINDRSERTSEDVAKQLVPVGRARVVRPGADLTFVAWGSTVPLCRRAADALQDAGFQAEVIDLRWISPWDIDTVVASAARTGRLVVAHEDMHTSGFGAEVLATVGERSPRPVAMARVCGPDTFLPYNYPNQLELLPSYERLVEAAAGLLNLDVQWEESSRREADLVVVNAIGSSPSDETVTIQVLHVREGQRVEEGSPLASVESNKAAMEIAAPSAGIVERMLLRVGDVVRVGTPMLEIRTAAAAGGPSAMPAAPRRPILTRRTGSIVRAAPAAGSPSVVVPAAHEVVISSICSALGSREVTNEELIRSYPDWKPEDVVQRTGIAKRYWIGPGENALTLAVQACRKLFEREKLSIADFDAIICSTGTPLSTTPSLACRVLKELSPSTGEVLMQAHDVNAACTGYLYALQQAFDMLGHNPDARILLVTAETLSPMLDHNDPGTLFLFGDAATASLVSCERRAGNIHARVNRPVLSALGEEEKVLFVPSLNSGEHVQMDGKRVFRVAVRKMIDMLEQASAARGIAVGDLSMIVPHQANERIIEAIQKAIKFPTEKVFYFIRDYGNTSSNTIPLALEALVPRQQAGGTVGLTAFGGGFTFGAAILDLL